MSIEALKKEVLVANLDLVTRNLVISTWGNVSGYDEETGLIVIKASGVPYSEMKLEHMVTVDLEGNVIDSKYTPSIDTPTHIELYKAWKDKGIRGMVHTHSVYATMWAQLGMDIPVYGTTHCDYFNGDIPCTRLMKQEEINGDYEKNTGTVILERMEEIDPVRMNAVLVHSHGPFVWGTSPAAAVLNSQVLDYVAKMAYMNYMMTDGKCARVQKEILDRHQSRKFGPNSYYGQKNI
ncbi:L-ribulose-5-phosphate 4-epimerase AraD [Clostridium sp. AM58-1XD]|uniref:L-ribulose-5-phosphate 4-epimerase AraD n=1 Tax=Clostridium sp. AM58-1XD TaxID=2292307 RepID=UPI000E496982|nr:L-ribulose-5-phosphate 4-epimerase AraD [Clostridium sp. AM58-1XD]RGY96467.1 L-ribulose-5-phosphate 4-epimerase AraD [Clostridium sp. AM58-1XD]